MKLQDEENRVQARALMPQTLPQLVERNGSQSSTTCGVIYSCVSKPKNSETVAFVREFEGIGNIGSW